MDKSRITDVIDRMEDVNALLEMCRGYAQSETPDMQTLASSLYQIKLKYETILMTLEHITRD